MIKYIIKRDGTKEEYTPSKLNKWAIWATDSLGDRVDWSGVVLDALSNCKEIENSQSLQKELINACLYKKDWPHNVMAGRLYAAWLHKALYDDEMPSVKKINKDLIKTGLVIDMGYTDAEFEAIESIIDHKRDFNYAHSQIKQIHHKYSISNLVSGIRYETPQYTFMRMAMRLSDDIEDSQEKLKLVQEYYDEFSLNRLNAPTPNYVNLGSPLNGYASCFPAGTLVDVINGSKKIEDITKGDLVFTKTGKIREVLGITQRPYIGSLVTFDSPIIVNRKTTPTFDHRYLVVSDGVKQWKEASKIKIGDYLFHPFKNEINESVEFWNLVKTDLIDKNYACIDGLIGRVNVCDNKGEFSARVTQIKNAELKNNKDFYRLIGYYLAEGHVTIIESKSTGHIGFTFNRKDADYVEDIRSIVKNIFGIETFIRDDSDKDNCLRIVVHSLPLAILFKKLCGSKAETKGDKLNIFTTSNQDSSLEILTGYLRGDGCATKQGYVASTISYDLLSMLRSIALKAKLFISISYNSRENHTGYANAKPIYNLNITTSGNSEFANKIKKDIEKIDNRNLRPGFTYFENDGAYSKVTGLNVTKFEGVVYDFEVEEDHSFTVEGICVHNCCLIEVSDNNESIDCGDMIASKMTAASAGIGTHHNLRSIGDPVRGGRFPHGGKRPYFATTAKNTIKGVQAGRAGAATFYFDIFEKEAKDLIMLQNPRTPEAKRNRDVHFAVMTNSFFARKARDDEQMFSFNCYTAPDLHAAMFSGDIEKFETLYKKYEEDDNFVKEYVSARDLCLTMLTQFEEVSTLYHLNIEEANRHTPFQEPIHSSNLCLEVCEPTSGYNSVQDLYRAGDYGHISFSQTSGNIVKLPYNLEVSVTNRGRTYAGSLTKGEFFSVPNSNTYKNYVVGDIVSKETPGEVALCSLGAVVLPNIHTDEQHHKTCKLALRMIDRCIHLSTYALPHIGFTAKSRLNAGVGHIGLATLLARKGLKYSTLEGRNEIHRISERHAYFVIKAALELGVEKGNAPWIHKTKWANGWLPIDSYKKAVDGLVTADLQYDWETLRSDIIKNGGIRFSCLINLMPTESSSKASGVPNGPYPIRALSLKKSDENNTVDWVATDSDLLGDQYEIGYDIPGVDMIKAYAVMQKFTDQSISVDTYKDRSKNVMLSDKQILTEYFTMIKYGVKSKYYSNTLTNSKDGSGEVQEMAVEENCGDSCKL
jgi:ribonucleoside-diphosphate reductase alpha chain